MKNLSRDRHCEAYPSPMQSTLYPEQRVTSARKHSPPRKDTLPGVALLLPEWNPLRQAQGDISFYFILLFIIFFLSACVETSQQTKGSPILHLPYPEVDLGEGKQGEDVTGEVIIQNKGTADLVIEDLTASCGCTALMLEQKVIPPGKEARFKVTLDTRGKSGEVFKTVTILSNDPNKHETIVNLKANIMAPKHPTFDVGKDLFNGECKSCHYDRAGNKKGGFLYLAICAFCHGSTGEGRPGSGPKINGSMPEDSLRYWIAQGRKGTAMPGYEKAKGGPLDEEQINSLVQFIKQRFH